MVLLKIPKLTNLLRYSQANKKAKSALILIAQGVEEIEFAAAADILRRSDFCVTIAGVPDKKLVCGLNNVKICPDVGVCDLKSCFDSIVLPGGPACAKTLCCNEAVGEILKEHEKCCRVIAAISHSPIALKANSIYMGKKITSHPDIKAEMEKGCKYCYLEDDVVVDRNLITARAPGSAIPFALSIVERLTCKEQAVLIAKQILTCYK